MVFRHKNLYVFAVIIIDKDKAVSVRKNDTECGVYIWDSSLVFTVFSFALHYEKTLFFFSLKKINK